MSPPEVWGPAVWRLFHTLSERINENAYSVLAPQLFNFIVRICKFLPCPECSNDASNFLAKIKLSDMKNKTQFKNTFYLFHNWVNAKKRKPLYNYSNMGIYNQYRLIDVVNNFISNYQTKGNMKLLTESFQRKLIISDFKRWFTYSINGFMPISIPQQLQIANNEIIEESVVEENQVVLEETVAFEEQEQVVEEEQQQITAEETVVVEENQEQVVVEEQEQFAVEEEQVVVEEQEQNAVEEEQVVVEEQEQIIEDIGINMEQIYEEPIIEEVVKPKKNKKNKNKK
jgi:hypothetical protein